MRIVIDTAPVTKFFARTADAVRTARLERCARILANAELAKADRIIEEQTLRVATKRHAAKQPSAKKQFLARKRAEATRAEFAFKRKHTALGRKLAKR